MKLSVALLASLFIACSSSPVPHSTSSSTVPEYTSNPRPANIMPGTIPVYIDTRFTSGHREEIHSAILQWNLALNGYETFEIVSDEFDMEIPIIEKVVLTGQGLLVLSRSAKDPALEDLPEGVLGWVVMEPGEEAHVVNLVEDVIGTRDLTSITAHEIGHVLRVPHLPIKNTLLYPYYPYGSRCVDIVTIKALATIRGWSWKNLNWCDPR